MFLTGVPSLFRSFLEASVELTNLLKDERYLENMDASHKEQWLKVMREAKEGRNPYLSEIGEINDIAKQIAAWSADLQELKDKGRGPLNVYERFKKAGMEEEYRSLYNFLSCDAHSNVRALISRHITFTESDFEVTYYKDEPLESFLATIDSTAALLLQLSESMHKHYGTDKVADVESMLEELSAMRAEYAA